MSECRILADAFSSFGQKNEPWLILFLNLQCLDHFIHNCMDPYYGFVPYVPCLLCLSTHMLYTCVDC